MASGRGPPPADPERLTSALALAAIVAIALFTRWWPGSLTDARGWWRRDETMYYRIACRVLHGRIDVDYFINPTLYAYVVAAAGAIVGGIRRLFGADATFDLFVARETAAPHLLLWAGRVVSIVASAGSVLVVARIGRRLFSPAVGLIAALMLALDGVAATSAPLCGNESLMVLLVLLAFCVAIEGSSLRRRISAGLLLGLATATKYSAGIFVLPLALAFGLRVGPALLAAAAGFLAGAPMAVANFRAFLQGFSTQAGYLTAGFTADDVVRGEVGYRFYARTFAELHLGVALALLCAAGILASIALAAVRRERAHLLLLAASLPLYLYLGAGIFCTQRFLLPALPFIVLHGAWLVEQLRRRVPALRSRPNGALALVLVAVAGAAAPAAARERDFLHHLYQPEPSCALMADLGPRLAANWKVAELAHYGVFRLLLERDPWAALDVPPPSDALRRQVDDWLARQGLLPTSIWLERMILDSPTLDDLKRELRESGVDVLLVVVSTRQLMTDLTIRPEPTTPGMRACPYWNEVVAWLTSLPNLFLGRSPDQRFTAALLDLRESAR